MPSASMNEQLSGVSKRVSVGAIVGTIATRSGRFGGVSVIGNCSVLDTTFGLTP